MWIVCGNEATNAIRNEHTNGEKVEFNDNGKAQVSKDIGEALTSNLDLIKKVKISEGDEE